MIERQVYEDFFAKTAREVDYAEAVAIRVYDDLELTDFRLDVCR